VNKTAQNRHKFQIAQRHSSDSEGVLAERWVAKTLVGQENWRQEDLTVAVLTVR